MKTAILTGFNTFGNYAVNPTEILARHLDNKVLAGHLIHAFVLPTTVGQVNHGIQIIERALAVKASVIISLGISSAAKGVRIETKCINWLENAKYCTEAENRKPIDFSFKAKEEKFMQFDRWNLPKLFDELATAGVSVEMSEDAGNYCCNAIMYRTLQGMKEQMVSLPFMFAHVPCTEESIAGIVDFDRNSKVLFSQEDLVVVVEKFLEAYA